MGVLNSSDVSMNHWAYTYITHLNRINIVKGYPDNRFKPNEQINRAEALTMIYRAWAVVYSKDLRNTRLLPKHVYKDADMFSWYGKALFYARSQYGKNPQIDGNDGYVSFFPVAGGFSPNNPVTRGEVLHMLVNALKLDLRQKHDSPFVDLQQEHPHYPWIMKGVNEGIVHGYFDKSFQPDQPINRAEMAKLIYNSFFK